MSPDEEQKFREVSEKRWQEKCDKVRKISATHNWYLTHNVSGFEYWKCRTCGYKGSTHIEAPMFGLDDLPRKITDSIPIENNFGDFRHKICFTCDQEQAYRLQVKNKNKTWSVYMVECIWGHWYTGATNNLWKRFKDHMKRKGAKFTHSNPINKFVYIEHCLSKSDALKREYAIKQLSKKEKEELASKNHVPPEYNMNLRQS